ncbi:hypothetical protein [Mycoplasma elephantis]|uniref:hypothetical protein n=1 Tax=Mycoplasma elephantis TaxID=114882 RepID=UPI0004810E57|nr:hypothetical protein [Mycoplasma elephantis]
MSFIKGGLGRDKIIQLSLWIATGVWMLALIILFALKANISSENKLGPSMGADLIAGFSLVFLILLIASVATTVILSWLKKRNVKGVK